MEKIILASLSPQRKQILKNLCIPFYEFTPPFEEIFPKGMAAENAAEYFAVQKTVKTAAALSKKAVNDEVSKNIRFIVAADTLIIHKKTIYGKPENEKEAFSFLEIFSGKTHSVYTGIAVYNRINGKTLSKTCISRVSFAKLSQREIENYLLCGEWQNAAGAYKIQGFAQYFIRRIEGSYSSIMGLPIFEFYEILKAQNYRFDGGILP